MKLAMMLMVGMAIGGLLVFLVPLIRFRKGKLSVKDVSELLIASSFFGFFFSLLLANMRLVDGMVMMTVVIGVFLTALLTRAAIYVIAGIKRLRR